MTAPEHPDGPRRFAAFDGNVRQGGLIDTNHIRILLCYAVQNCAPVTSQQLQQALCDASLVNPFELHDALGQLCHLGALREETDGYHITDNGRIIAANLTTDLPLTIRERALDALIKLQAKQQQIAQLRAEILPYGREFLLRCKMDDSGHTLLDLSIAFPDLEMAEHARERFWQNSSDIYQLLVAGLTGDRSMAAPFFEEKKKK